MSLMLLSLPLLAATGTPPASVNVQLFQPAVEGRWFQLQDAESGSNKTFAWRTTLSYSDRPLEYLDALGNEVVSVGSITQVDIGASYRHDRFRFGAGIPVQLSSTGAAGDIGLGFGQPHVEAAYQLLEERNKKPLSATVSGRMNLPNLGGSGAGLDAPFGGQIHAVVGKNFKKRWHLGGQLGATILPSAELEGAKWGSRLELGLGAEFLIGDEIKMVTEFTAKPQLADFSQNAMELLFGTALRVMNEYTLRPALAIALSDAPGVPRFRAVLQVRRAIAVPTPKPKVTVKMPVVLDSDKDGINDDKDKCPKEAEDMDAFQDEDGCPEPTSVTVKLLDTDHQRVVPTTVWKAGKHSGKHGTTVAMAAGVHTFEVGKTKLKAKIGNGKPVTVTVLLPAPRGSLTVQARDKTGKKIAGATWNAKGGVLTTKEHFAGTVVKVRPDTYELKAQAPGYRPASKTVTVLKDKSANLVLTMLPARATVTAKAIEIKESVYFETGKAIIKMQSLDLLAELAELIKDHPELKKIRIEGHTDNRGNAKANLKLSQARADAVRQALVKGGVAAERLTAVGYGEERPLDKANTKAAWKKNRRVDFVVEKQAIK